MDNIRKLIEKLSDSDAKFARKALNYYDGRQTEELEKLLSDASSFRKHWREKGIIARTRNITKAIVDKSGLLFSGAAPVLEVFTSEGINEAASTKLLDLMNDSEWVEFFSNFDNQVRLLKTSIVLVQRGEDGGILFDALHRGNSVVKIDPVTRAIKELLFHVGDDYYRHFTQDEIVDYVFDVKTQTLSIDNKQINTYGLIPAVAFHDTQTPRNGIWNVAPHDLIGLNEAYNLHLSDSEYAAAWAKVKTLFTNAEIDADPGRLEPIYVEGEALPIMRPSSSPSTVGGPGRIVQITAGSGETPYVEYKGPDVNLDPIDGMYSSWVKDFAADWSVRLAAAGSGTASSGFQLIVEEMPNLELRKARQKMMSAGFARLYRVLMMVMNGALPVDGELFISFSAPSLPVDQKIELEVWSRKITEGLATREDYFMSVEGLTAEEAKVKVIRIDATNATAPSAPVRQTVVRVT